MKLTLHGKSGPPGGTCIELESSSSRMIVDPRIPTGGKADDLPVVKGFYRDDKPSVDAVLISHILSGTFGFLRHIHPDIPIYVSKGADAFIKVSRVFGVPSAERQNIAQIKTRKKFKAGAFNVTPHMVDYWAFDSMAFTIESGGKKILYSGDPRGHGMKSALFERTIKEPPESIDCLLAGGDVPRKADTNAGTEDDASTMIRNALLRTNDIAFIFSPPQELERFATIYNVCRSAGRILVIDLYMAFVLSLLRSASKKIPQPDWHDIRVRFTGAQAETLSAAGYRELLQFYSKRKIVDGEIARRRPRLLMHFHDLTGPKGVIKELGNVAGSQAVWSMGKDLLDGPTGEYLSGKGLLIEVLQPRAQASVECLEQFICAIKPKAVLTVNAKPPGLSAATVPSGPVTALESSGSMEI